MGRQGAGVRPREERQGRLGVELCPHADRTAQGRLPMCVHHCQSGVMYYGTMEELAKKAAEKPKMVLFSLNEG